MTLYGIDWEVLPIHLACMLRAPSTVLDCLVTDTTAQQPLRRLQSNNNNNGVKGKRRRPEQKKRHSLFRPMSVSHSSSQSLPSLQSKPPLQQHSTLPAGSFPVLTQIPMVTTNSSHHNRDVLGNSTKGHTIHDRNNNSNKSNPSSAVGRDNPSEYDNTDQEVVHSATSSTSNVDSIVLTDDVSRQGVGHKEEEDDDDDENGNGSSSEVFQPSPRKIKTNKTTTTTATTTDHSPVSSLSVSRNEAWPLNWNLPTLLDQIQSILPLHLACLYGAGSTIVWKLLKVYPDATRTACAGMLPVHMACANLSLPPPIRHPEEQVFGADTESAGLPVVLEYLVSVYPDGTQACIMGGLTPDALLMQCVEEQDFRGQCLEALMGISYTHSRFDRDDDDDGVVVKKNNGPNDDDEKEEEGCLFSDGVQNAGSGVCSAIPLNIGPSVDGHGKDHNNNNNNNNNDGDANDGERPKTPNVGKDTQVVVLVQNHAGADRNATEEAPLDTFS